MPVNQTKLLTSSKQVVFIPLMQQLSPVRVTIKQFDLLFSNCSLPTRACQCIPVDEHWLRRDHAK